MSCGEQAVIDLESKEDAARLGMESRSILKSIQTEETKLSQSINPTRSDLHYFRARHNYYRLSLLRLPIEERSLLEPILARFFDRIIGFEPLGAETPAPFLQSVQRVEMPKFSSVLPSIQVSVSSQNSNLLDEVISQLQLVRLALAAESTPEAKRVLCDGVDRIIAKIKAQKNEYTAT